MRNIAALFFLAATHLPFVALADDPNIKVTTFRYVHNELRVAEICGKVLIPYEESMRVEVKVDPGKNEGTYVVLPPREGVWCHIVQTHAGRADVTLVKSGATVGETFASMK